MCGLGYIKHEKNIKQNEAHIITQKIQKFNIPKYVEAQNQKNTSLAMHYIFWLMARPGRPGFKHAEIK